MIIKMRARLYAVSNFNYEIAEVYFINIKFMVITTLK